MYKYDKVFGLIFHIIEGIMNVNWDQIFETYPTLETDRCILRPITMDDASALFKMMSDEHIIRYLGRLPMVSMDEAVERVLIYLKGFEEQGNITWMICWRDSGEVIGLCTVFNLLKSHYRAELGYMLLPAWWRQGIMSEVVPLVLKWGFEVMQLHSFMANIDPENEASRRLLEKHGFVQEAYFREDFYHPLHQKFTDTVILSLIKPR